MNAEWLDDRVYSIYADDDWASNIPMDSEFVDIGPNHDLYSLSMFHQLHCLDAMRYAFAAAKASALVFSGNGTGVEHHVTHCLVYLREMVLCAADTTLEPADAVVLDKLGNEHLGSTGDNVIHRCRDWTQIREVVVLVRVLYIYYNDKCEIRYIGLVCTHNKLRMNTFVGIIVYASHLVHMAC